MDLKINVLMMQVAMLTDEMEQVHEFVYFGKMFMKDGETIWDNHIWAYYDRKVVSGMSSVMKKKCKKKNTVYNTYLCSLSFMEVRIGYIRS